MTRRIWRVRCPSLAPTAPQPRRLMAKDTAHALLALLVLLCFFFLAWVC